MIFTALGLSLFALPATVALQVFDVAVGRDGLVYTPEYVTAAPGDIINFVFHPKNHTVTQNSFDAPCVPLEGAINSGFMSVPTELTGLPNFPVVVNDTNPVWFHCEQTGHCGQGMVFAINPPSPPSSHSFSAEKALAIAINGTSNATSKSTSYSAPTSATPTNHMVTVGKDGQLRYDPEFITAAVGDTVTYQFFPKNHTVTQSNFAEPCQPKADTSPDHTPGFDSGFMPVAANDATPHLFTITVNDTNPIWAYCRQVGHCGSGMVMGINPPTSGNTFDAFQMLAEKTNGTSSNATTSNATTSTPTNHMVTVGKDGQLRYDPEFITAAVGDTVTYQFFPKNHTVTQSNFAEPCQPKADTSSDHTPGFDSGFMPVAANDATPHLFTITVNDTNPIWAYCRQVGHCGSGMVMGINPPTSGNTFDAFQMLAEKINGTSSASTPGAIGTDYSSTYGSSASTASAPGAMGTDYSSTYGSSASTASAPAATSTGYGSTYGSSASTVKGAVDDAAVGGSSINVSDLTRNTYIIIGLLCALLLGLIVLAMFTLFQRGGGYKAVPISTAAPGILPYSQKGPYSTPYSTADAEEYRD